MKRRLRIGRAFGVEVAIDWSWIVAFVFAAWTLVALAHRAMPSLGPVATAAFGAAIAVGIFASLAFHELAHGLAARACGVPVRHVTLFVLGGVTDTDRRRATPTAEAIAALVAPVASAALGIVSILAVVIVGGPLPRSAAELDRLGVPLAILLGVGAANVLIAALNLLPAWPLDGGRFVRAVLWRLTGDVDRATRYAALAAQAIGWQLVAFGVVLAVVARGSLVPGGVWIAFVGWFIASAAAQGYEGVVLEDELASIRVDRLMRRTFLAIAADATVATAARGWQTRGHDRAVPVVWGEQLVGFVTPRDVHAVVPSERDKILVAQVARSAPIVAPNEALLSVLVRLDVIPTERVAVVDEQKLVGVLERADLTAFVEAYRRGETTRGEGRRTLALAGMDGGSRCD